LKISNGRQQHSSNTLVTMVGVDGLDYLMLVVESNFADKADRNIFIQS